ncbi:MAG: hypothetical protein EXR65_00570 [Dehalococcoidia bacterium]|nr:hypothetical protein [Dehalococcoidia bacterium]
MLTAWMGERFFRSFRAGEGDATPFDAVLMQRERRVGVTVGALWEDADGDPVPGGGSFEQMLAADLDPGAYVLWVPPGGSLPVSEPQRSQFRLLVAGALRGLAPGQRRELRVPVQLELAKVDDEGAYMSVSGPLAARWTHLSEGVKGAYHLDARALRRLSEEEAEVEIVLARVRDRAALLNREQRTSVAVHDAWLLSRLPAEEPAGLTVIGAPPDFEPGDGAAVRRLLRRHVRRAAEQRAAGSCELAALLLVGALAHIDDELATAALRGMSPALYGALDLIALVADGRVRQVLQPRSLPWTG